MVAFGGCGGPLIRLCACAKLELTGAHKAATVRPSTSTPFLVFLIAQLLPASAGQNNTLPQGPGGKGSHSASHRAPQSVSAVSKTTLVRRCCRRGLLGLNTVVDDFAPVRHGDFTLVGEVQLTGTILVLRTDNRDLVSRHKSGAGPSIAICKSTEY